MLRWTLQRGDCRTLMAEMPAGSVDSIVTDPPYGLSFMGKGWDHGVPGVEFWEAALRVAKPGAHLLAFGGTRTFHRLTVAIDDAGWEIRDCVMWVYGSGFPKSLDVSKAIDTMDNRYTLERKFKFTAWVRSQGVTARQIDDATGTCMGGHYTTQATQPAIMTREHLEACRHLFGHVPDWVEREVDVRSMESENMKRREVVGHGYRVRGESTVELAGHSAGIYPLTAPATAEARAWEGWGTALKPAWEPVIVARKPLEGTVAENVLKYGTGAVNVDGCRVGGEEGRWPANVIHDGSDEVVGLMAEAARFFYCAKASKRDRDEGCEGLVAKTVGVWGGDEDDLTEGKKRVLPARNHHPTVKPTDLMRYLCRLVTPPGGLVLDPFGGSGSTGKAALLDGFRVTLCELSEEYWPIIEARCKWAANERSEGKVSAMVQRTLFSGD